MGNKVSSPALILSRTFRMSPQSGDLVSKMIPPNAFAAGSPEPPPRSKGTLRLHSMRFCPFAQRSLLVLLAKQIPHEIVNINLTNKPEWFLKKYERGKVPLLEDDGVLLPESMIVSEYLDEVYPGPKLLPQDPYSKALDKAFMESFRFMTIFKPLKNQDTYKEGYADFWKSANVVEKELARRGTRFLGGSEPGFVDFMIWPFFQISAALPNLFPGISVPKETHQKVAQWMDNMFQTREVRSVVNQEHFTEYIKSRLGEKVNYDVGL